MLIIKILLALVTALLIIFLAFIYAAGKTNKALDKAAEDELAKKRPADIFWQPRICDLQFGPGNLQCKIFGACRPEEGRCR